MRLFHDSSGEKYWRLTLLSLDHKDDAFRPYYLCRCDCGDYIVARLDCIKSGNTKSCGCLHAETSAYNLKTYNEKHGGCGTRLYRIWIGMGYRCRAFGTETGRNYADAGIKVCEEWSNFQNFKEWALKNGYLDNLTIDRINVASGYQPSNCRWITISEQQRNKNKTLKVSINGACITLKDACELRGVSYNKAWMRLKRLGWSVEDALEPNIYKHGGKKA